MTEIILENKIKKIFNHNKIIEIKINDNSEELLDYKQLEIKAKKEQPIKVETFKKCLETANKFNDIKKDDKVNKISIKFTNFKFEKDIKGKIKDDLSEELSKIGICYEN
ncbi:MAG: hypothetical protein IKR42_05355, partial [Campylobacter sp.]|nr:hypothetical protein [Campylobacter sp.]